MTEDIQKAVDLLRRGELVGMPTETVYGLAGDATNSKAIAKIYATKGRPSFNPLIIHGYGVSQLEGVAVFTQVAYDLAERFWPGPLTLVLQRRLDSPIDLLASGGLSTIALRIPQHPTALALLKAFDKLVAAPSANLSNKISPTTREMVLRDFPDLYVLEGGSSQVGLESTIIDLSEGIPTLLRPGGIAIEEIQEVVGNVHLYQGSDVTAPGMLKKHYAPQHPLRLNASEKHAGEIFIGFGKILDADLNLSPSGDLTEAASNLYHMLNQADDMAMDAGIAVSPIPLEGLGVAINDRLARAAAK